MQQSKARDLFSLGALEKERRGGLGSGGGGVGVREEKMVKQQRRKDFRRTETAEQ